MIEAFYRYIIGILEQKSGYNLTNAKKYFGRDYELFLSFYQTVLTVGKLTTKSKEVKKRAGITDPIFLSLIKSSIYKTQIAINKWVDANDVLIKDRQKLLGTAKTLATEIEKLKSFNADKLIARIEKDLELGEQTSARINRWFRITESEAKATVDYSISKLSLDEVIDKCIKEAEDSYTRVGQMTDQFLEESLSGTYFHGLTQLINSYAETTIAEQQSLLALQIQNYLNEV